MLIRYAGGKCQHCGYDKCFRALEFHHTNPNEKDFGVSRNLTKSIASLKEEVDKCILLCSNCHAEEHDRLFREGYSQFDSDIQINRQVEGSSPSTPVIKNQFDFLKNICYNIYITNKKLQVSKTE